MKFPLPAILMTLSAGAAAPGQVIDSIRLTPVPGKLPGTMTARLTGSVPSSGEYFMEDSVDQIQWNRVSPVLHPPGGQLDWSLQSGPVWQTAGIYYPDLPTAGSNTWYQRRFYRLRSLRPAAGVPQPVPVQPVGRLWHSAAAVQYHVTTAGNWRIYVNGENITVHSPDLKMKWECWGSPLHENMNGKHIKDWEGTRRTLLLPDSTIITMTNGEKVAGSGVVTLRTISIYDADQTHRLNPQTNTVELSAFLPRAGEAAEADGETMRVWHLGGGRYYGENIYTEEVPGGAPAAQNVAPLGITGGDANPTHLKDFYDDPRLGHT